ncbi:hypothetical protein [Thalassobius sp. MITS945101]|uniref:hypothetical protein n=1 Tax=Thalassobius sp. MITS945101 TaxID=3096994 RepID=UPI00399C1DB0
MKKTKGGPQRRQGKSNQNADQYPTVLPSQVALGKVAGENFRSVAEVCQSLPAFALNNPMI